MSQIPTEKLEAYADLLVRVGLNVQPGDTLLITNSALNGGVALHTAPLVREVVKRAYQVGAHYVEVMWSDEEVLRLRFEHAPAASFKESPAWRSEARLAMTRAGNPQLTIVSSSPDLLAGQDPERIAQFQKTRWRQNEEVSRYVRRNAMTWCVAAAAGPSWAAKLFPDLPPEQQVAQLWDVLFTLTRLDRPDPVAAWQEHVRALDARRQYLTAKQYDAVHFRGPGTDLRVGLPKGHIWYGGKSTSESGIPFTANIPTEEVFTLPHRARTKGVVTATMPLNIAGALVEGFTMRFEEGKVVEAHAERNNDLLQQVLSHDEGSRRLGEVALVPHSSPVARSGLLFYNTLLDENAASHFALGGGYSFCLEGGTEMTQEEFAARGGNESQLHIDFMIGSDKVDVDGVREDGETEPIMRQGEWTFAV